MRMITETNDRNSKQPILVTGCKGYIGQYLIRHLTELGREVIGVGREDCDITNTSALTEIVESIRPSTIYHLAGITGVEDSWRNPSEFYRVNVLGVQSVLESCRRSRARMVFVSGYLYDAKANPPVDEGSPIGPMNPYAHSKWLGENICEFFYQHYGVPCIIMRPFNVYGGQQSNDFLIPRLIEQVISDSRTIIAKDYAPVRDYLYINDLISAMVEVLKYEVDFGVFNVGTGVGHSVKEVGELIQNIWGTSKTFVSLDSPRQNEISVSIANINKIKRELDWQPVYSLETGLREMFELST